MNETHQLLPRACKSQLIMTEIAGELLVYDRNSNRAHCLNPTAAMVWARCDGLTTIAEMCQLLEDQMNTPVADEVVWFALDQLRDSHLLQESFARPARLQQVSRRTLMKRLGLAAALTMPLVTSIVAPTAASAATCGASGTPCTVNSNCCSNNCVDNGRGGGLECI
jgi:hypothetical protein